jgi:hypothetical protein
VTGLVARTSLDGKRAVQAAQALNPRWLDVIDKHSP